MMGVQFGADDFVQLRFGGSASCPNDVFHDFGHAMKLIRPCDEIKHGKVFKKLVTMVLRHAANASDNQIGLVRLDFLHKADLADGLPFGLVSDGACVEDDEVGVGDLVDDLDRVVGLDAVAAVALAGVAVAAGAEREVVDVQGFDGVVPLQSLLDRAQGVGGVAVLAGAAVQDQGVQSGSPVEIEV